MAGQRQVPHIALPADDRCRLGQREDGPGGSFLSAAVVLAVALVLGGLVMLTLRRQADKPVLVAQPEAAAASPRPRAAAAQRAGAPRGR